MQANERKARKKTKQEALEIEYIKTRMASKEIRAKKNKEDRGTLFDRMTLKRGNKQQKQAKRRK